MRLGVPRALLLAALTSCAPWPATGSLYRGRCTHVGVRPAAAAEGYAVTLQLTTDWPHCP